MEYVALRARLAAAEEWLREMVGELLDSGKPTVAGLIENFLSNADSATADPKVYCQQPGCGATTPTGCRREDCTSGFGWPHTPPSTVSAGEVTK
jgi:hypothetical protein